MNRKLRTTLPILPQDLKPNVPNYSMLQSSEKQQREKQKQNFDSRHVAHTLAPLKEGMTVWVPYHKCLGKVITQVGPRSYQIETSYGVLRRKRRHLISSPNEQFTSDEDFDILPDIPNNDTNHSEVQLQPTQNGTVYTHSGRASRPPKRYIANTN